MLDQQQQRNKSCRSNSSMYRRKLEPTTSTTRRRQRSTSPTRQRRGPQRTITPLINPYQPDAETLSDCDSSTGSNNSYCWEQDEEMLAKSFDILRSLMHAMIWIVLGFSTGYLYLCYANDTTTTTDMPDAPVSVMALTDDLITKMQRDNHLHEQEIHALRMELEGLALQQRRQVVENVLDAPEGDDLMYREEPVEVSQPPPPPQSRLRGGAQQQPEDADPNWEKKVHLINRSGQPIQLYWVSDHRVDDDHVEWVLISDPLKAIAPSATFHFHARPSHTFAVQYHDKVEHDHVIEDALWFTVDEDDNNNPDQYIIVGQDWHIVAPDDNGQHLEAK